MKRIPVLLLSFILAFPAFSKKGYDIHITFKQDIPDSMVYLVRYYGKDIPTIYKIDSSKVVDKRKISFERKDSLLGGVCMVMFKKSTVLFDFLVENGTTLKITTDTAIAKGTSYFATTKGWEGKASEENKRYFAYKAFLENLSGRGLAIYQSLQTATSAEDSLKLKKGFDTLKKEHTAYCKNYVNEYPHTLLSAILNASLEPEVPEGPHYEKDGKTEDDLFGYYYYRTHYWDRFDFKDDRLIHTNIYDKKLKDYFEKWVYPIPDTVNAEADKLLEKTRGTRELFKYTLNRLTGDALESKLMGMDEVFVHLVEKYYMKGDAYWLDSAGLAKYEDRAKKIAPNVLGNIAPELDLSDVYTLQNKSLHSLSAKYTLLVIWSYDCGHCQKEIPRIDSLYEQELKQKGVKVYSIGNGKELSEIKKFIEKNKITEWTNVVDLKGSAQVKAKYDANTTPKIYLLDENKVIIGKNIDHSNILKVIEITEQKKAHQTVSAH